MFHRTTTRKLDIPLFALALGILVMAVASALR